MQNAGILGAWLLKSTWESRALWVAICENTKMHTHTGPLFIFANKQQKQIGQTPHLKHEHSSKEVGTEEKSRNVFRYILTSGHEGTHSIPTEHMGAPVPRSVAPNLAALVRGQISAGHTEPETLVSFPWQMKGNWQMFWAPPVRRMYGIHSKTTWKSVVWLALVRGRTILEIWVFSPDSFSEYFLLIFVIKLLWFESKWKWPTYGWKYYEKGIPPFQFTDIYITLRIPLKGNMINVSLHLWWIIVKEPGL